MDALYYNNSLAYLVFLRPAPAKIANDGQFISPVTAVVFVQFRCFCFFPEFICQIKFKSYTTQNLKRAKILILFAGGPAYLISIIL